MKSYCLAFALVICLIPVVQAQENKSDIVAFNNDSLDERAATRILFYNQKKNAPAGEFDISYGRPVWKKEYEDPAKFDAMTKGKTWRLGSNFWTVLDTNIPLKIADKEIAPGQWYLGLNRSQDGASWGLAFISPSRVRSKLMDAFQMNGAPIEFLIPLTLEKAGASQEKLTIVISPVAGNIKEASLTISWGNLKLSAPIQVSLEN